MNWLNKILETNLNAVLVTVLIHMAVLFAFLLVQLSPPVQNTEAVIIMDPENLEEMDKYFEAKEEIEKKIEELAKAQNLSLDDIRNLSSNAVPQNKQWENETQKLSAKELQKLYEDELRKEMYGDDYDEITEKLNTEIEREEFDIKRNSNQENKQGNQEYYSGPALVKVELEDQNRSHVFIDIPVFICRGSGTIVISIEIDEYGKVKNTKVENAKASIDLDCMIEEASRAAKSSIFGIKKGKKTTKGKITYQFIEQV